MRVAEIDHDIRTFLDPMDTPEFEVEHAVENLLSAAKDIAGYRLNNERRGILMECKTSLALALDALQITFDDLEGKR